MFTVEQAVENWKNDLRQKQTVMESDIEELESHLRDEMERLAPLGLSEDEAFLIATRRIGDTTQMAAEFAKVNTAAIWKTRFFWMVAGIILLQFFSSCANFLASGSVLLGQHFTGMGWLATGVLVSILQTVLLLVFFYVLYTIPVKTSFFKNIQKRNTIGIIVALVAASFLLNLLIKFISEILVANLYGFQALGEFSLGLQYSALGLAVLWPILWLTLLLWLMPKKTQTT